MKSFFEKLVYQGITFIMKVSGNFISIALRPIKAEGVQLKPTNKHPATKTAIIIAGPLKPELDFTLETVRLYKTTLLANTEIIVSTWEDEDVQTLKQIAACGAHIVTSQKPSNRGISNINLQITTIVNALKKCEELGVEYVLKTRTDTRIYNANIEDYLRGLLKIFPAKPEFNQKYRIVGFSLNTYLYRLYTISDIVLYGHISDMQKFWGVPLEARTSEPENASKTLRSWSEAKMVETYLTASYLENVGKKLTWTLKDSFQALAENFIIVDDQTIDLYWYKYAYWKEYRNQHYSSARNDVNVTFRDWVMLYTNSDGYASAPEYMLDVPFKSKVNN